jgi:hypothetical protein
LFEYEINTFVLNNKIRRNVQYFEKPIIIKLKRNKSPMKILILLSAFLIKILTANVTNVTNLLKLSDFEYNYSNYRVYAASKWYFLDTLPSTTVKYWYSHYAIRTKIKNYYETTDGMELIADD